MRRVGALLLRVALGEQATRPGHCADGLHNRRLPGTLGQGALGLRERGALWNAVTTEKKKTAARPATWTCGCAHSMRTGA